MITADSSVWIDYLAGRQTGQAQALDQLLDDGASEIVLLDVVLMEVLRGFRHPGEWLATRQLFAELPVFTAGGEKVAVAAASMYRDLRQQGITVRSAIDLLVGAWCIENGCMLIHGDRDFDAMDGLQAWEAQ